jgi:hypothetical protein
VFYATSTMPLICHAVSISAHFTTISKSDFWSAIERQTIEIFDMFGPNIFAFWDNA